jgi:hypothetical protein
MGALFIVAPHLVVWKRKTFSQSSNCNSLPWQ